MSISDESFTNQYHAHVACSCNYELVCVDDKYSKPNSYLGEDVAHNFINSMIAESKYCSDAMKEHFSKELVMTKEDDGDFENPTKCWIYENVYVDGDVKARDNLSHHWKM